MSVYSGWISAHIKFSFMLFKLRRSLERGLGGIPSYSIVVSCIVTFLQGEWFYLSLREALTLEIVNLFTIVIEYLLI